MAHLSVRSKQTLLTFLLLSSVRPACSQNTGANRDSDRFSKFSIAREAYTYTRRMYLHTGTSEDALPLARQMRDLLRQKGIALEYGEYPEGHNWGNWRSRLPLILTPFAPIRR
jgi:enterochelin esterase-like enzyme